MRILQVTTVASTLEAFLLPFALEARKNDWQIFALAAGIENSKKCRESFDGVFEISWSRNPGDLKGLWGAVTRVRRVVEEQSIDIVHVHTPIAAFVTRFALRNLRQKRKIKVVYTAHGFHFHRNGKAARNLLFKFAERVAGKWTDALVVINREDEAAARDARILDVGRLFYVPGIGIDIDFYCSSDEIARAGKDIRRALNIDSGEKIILMIAEFTKNKRHRDVVEAVSHLRQQGRTDVHLLLAGRGREEAAIRELARDLGAGAQVHFLGHCSDIRPLLSEASLLVLASAREGLPRSIMEALAMGRPVVGSDARGVRDLLDSECGILYPIGDVAKLRAAMTRLLEDPEQAQKIAENGKRKIVGYGIRSVLDQYNSIYRLLFSDTKIKNS